MHLLSVGEFLGQKSCAFEVLNDPITCADYLLRGQQPSGFDKAWNRAQYNSEKGK